MLLIVDLINVVMKITDHFYRNRNTENIFELWNEYLKYNCATLKCIFQLQAGAISRSKEVHLCFEIVASIDM